MRKSIVIWALLLYTNSLVAQNSFKEFIDVFPVYTWNELLETIPIMPLGKELDIEKANQFMWGEHAKGIRLNVNNYSWEVNGPHYMLADSTFNRSDLGQFTSKCDYPNKPFNYLYPVARVNMDQMVLLIVFYDAFDWELGTLKRLEVYTYRLKDEKLISAIDISHSIILDDYRLINYQYFYKENPNSGETEEKLFKVEYALRKDGYFQEISKLQVAILLKQKKEFFVEINDNDGWTNVRDKQSIKSRILYQIKNKSTLVVEETEDPDWVRVRSVWLSELKEGFVPKPYYGERSSIPISGGYLHVSRISKIDKK